MESMLPSPWVVDNVQQKSTYYQNKNFLNAKANGILGIVSNR